MNNEESDSQRERERETGRGRERHHILFVVVLVVVVVLSGESLGSKNTADGFFTFKFCLQRFPTLN